PASEAPDAHPLTVAANIDPVIAFVMASAPLSTPIPKKIQNSSMYSSGVAGISSSARFQRRRRKKSPTMKRYTSLRRRDLVLLDLAVRHDERRQAERLLRKADAIAAQRHAAAQRLARLREFLRLAQRAEARGEVLDGEIAEIRVCVRRELRAIDLPVLQPIEDLAH